MIKPITPQARNRLVYLFDVTRELRAEAMKMSRKGRVKGGPLGRLLHASRQEYQLWQRRDPLAKRAQQRLDIERHTYDGKVYLYTWGRDCDMCERDDIQVLPANLTIIENAINHIYDIAEGPTTHHFVTPDDYAQFETSWRDAALEAFEDGHPHMVCGGSARY